MPPVIFFLIKMADQELEDYIKHRQSWYYWDHMAKLYVHNVGPHRSREKGIDSISRNPNITMEIVEANPFFPWDYLALAGNPSISLETAEKFLVVENGWKEDPINDEIFYESDISLNANVTWEIVKAHPEKRWNYEKMSRNPNITWEIIQSNPDKPWSIKEFSKNPNVTWELIRDNPDLPWDFYGTMSHMKFLPEDLPEILAGEKYGFTIQFLSENPNLTWDIVKANPEIEWDYHTMTVNPNITWEIMQTNSEFAQYKLMFLANPNISWKIIDSQLSKSYPGDALLELEFNPTILQNELIRQEILEYGGEVPPGVTKYPISLDYEPEEISPPKIVRENEIQKYAVERAAQVFWDFVLSKPDEAWNPYHLMANPNLTPDIIVKNKLRGVIKSGPIREFVWAPGVLSQNPNIDAAFVRDFIKTDPDRGWDFEALSENPGITPEIVLENLELPWKLRGLSKNPNTTWDLVLAIRETNPVIANLPDVRHYLMRNDADDEWDLDELSANPGITWEVVKNNPLVPWNYSRLSINPNVTWEIVQANPRQPWDFMGLAQNPNITDEIIRNNLTLPWGDFVKARATGDFSKIDWEIEQRLWTKNITWDMVQKYPEAPWDWFIMTANPNITWDIIVENPDKPWVIGHFSANPNLTTQIIDENPDVEWDYYSISANPMTLQRKMILEKVLLEEESRISREAEATLIEGFDMLERKEFDLPLVELMLNVITQQNELLEMRSTRTKK